MEQPPDSYPLGLRNTPLLNVVKKAGNNAWGTINGVDAFHGSDDVSLFSSSLPILPREKVYFAASEHAVRSSDDVSATVSNDTDAEVKDSIENPDFEDIGLLLPDDEELLAGILDNLDLSEFPIQMDELEEYDVFDSGGGMELDFDPVECTPIGTTWTNASDIYVGNDTAQYGVPNGSGAVVGEHPYGEHPSRTLFVRNINSNVEDEELRGLFEQYGDIRTLYTACKHRGFVMIAYYDIRSARGAMRALQNKPLRRRKLDIHFSIPKNNPSDKDINQGTLVVFNLDSSVSNDNLLQIFAAYGEVKEIRETPHRRHHRFIEYYDVRDAEAALRSLNGSDIAGKRIKLEPSRPGGARRNLMQQMTHELDHDETRSYRHRVGSPLINSPPGNWVHIGSPNNNTFLQDLSRSPTLYSGSLTNNHFLDLPSVLPPRLNSMKVSPIRKEQSWINQAISNSSPTNGILFQHSLSLPEHVGIIPNMRSSPRTTFSPTPVGMMPSMSSSPRTTFGPTSVKMMQGMSSSPRATIGPPTSSGTGVGTLSGTQFLWGSPAPYSEHTHSSAWPTSSTGHSFMSNGQKLGFPHSRLVPLSHHHVGSAPSCEPFDRKSGFFSESSDSLFARPVSFGGLGPIGRNDGSLMRKTGVSMSANFSENGFPGLRMMPSQRSGHLFHGSAPYTGSASSGFEGFEHIHSRRDDYVGVQLDDKTQYQLELEKIVGGEDTRTTLMIKNIPNKYTSRMLLATIDEKHMGTYDFLYLPIDFKNKCNVGYAFINMVSPSHIIPFCEAFNGKKWEKFNSEKVATLAYARIQGLKALTDHFQDSSLMNEDKLYRPIIFHAEGPDNFYQDRFPPNYMIGSECWQDGKYIGAPLEFPAKNNPEENPEGRNPSGSDEGSSKWPP